MDISPILFLSPGITAAKKPAKADLFSSLPGRLKGVSDLAICSRMPAETEDRLRRLDNPH